MNAFSRLFRKNAPVATARASLSFDALPVPVASDALPGEVDAALGAARITIRSFGVNSNENDDCRPIIEIPGLRSIKFDPAELGHLVSDAWPFLNCGQVARAVAYANNRCVIEARRIGEALVIQKKPLKWWEKQQPRWWEQ